MKNIFLKLIPVFMFAFLSLVQTVFSQDADKVLFNLNQKYYSIKGSGFNDLYFEINADTLKQELNNLKSYGVIRDLRLKVWWLAPDRIQVQVDGISENFVDLHQYIKEVLAPFVDIVLSRPVGEQFGSFKWSVKKDKGNFILSGFDSKVSSGVLEANLDITKDYVISKMTLKRASGTEEGYFSSSAKSWSGGKKVIDEINLKSVDGLQTKTLKHKITYQTVGRFGFPQKIDTNIQQVLQQINPATQKPFQQTSSSLVKFEQVQINQGQAKAFFSR